MVEVTRVLSVLAMSFAIALGAAAAEPPPIEPALQAAVASGRVLAEGRRTLIVVTLSGLPDDPTMPAMLTPQVVGQAVEALRGRLFRRDGTRSPDGTWTFEVPVLARARGSSEVGFTLVTFDCRSRCRELTLRTSIAIDVRAP